MRIERSDYKGIPNHVIKQVAEENKRAAIVCGLGESLEGIERANDIFYIGVNHICEHFTPDIVYIADRIAPKHDYRKQYGEEMGADANRRVKIMVESDSRWVFTTTGNLELPNSEKVYIRCKEIGNSKGDLGKAIKKNYLWANRTSVIGALSIAIILGFTKIGVIGFDLYGGHAYKHNTKHGLKTKEHIEALNKCCRLILTYCWEKGIGIQNLSKQSKIYTIPKRDYHDFLNDCRN